MEEYKFNHHVAKGFLKNFSIPRGKPFCYDSSNPSQGVVPCERRHFAKLDQYVVLDSTGQRDVSLERDFYGELDNGAPLLFEKIIRAAENKAPPNLRTEDRRFLDRLIYNQYKRSPETHLAANLRDEVTEKLDYFDPLVQEAEYNNARIEVLGLEGNQVLSSLAKMNLWVSRNTNQKKSFIIGSNPVWKDLDNDGNLSYWLPISSDVIVGLVKNEIKENYSEVSDGDAIRKMNERVARQSTEIGGRSQELIESLRKFCRTQDSE
jgi:Protein of unknown function (DUF4238)